MKICFVAPASSAHILKWSKWFSQHGHEVHVISFDKGDIPGAEVHFIDIGVDTQGSDLGKIKYLFQGRRIRRLIDLIKPDIINAHYATSYGTALALSGEKNYILSVWGSDIYDFPNKGLAYKLLLKYSLRKAKYLFSTSRAMAKEASKYTDKKFEITPFGVDMTLFNPDKRTRKNDNKFVIGTVKGLSSKYGIDVLLRAASRIYKEHPEVQLEVRIAGKGPEEKQLRQLAVELGIDSIVHWLGFITQEMAAIEWANMDVGITSSSSSSESFGVSAVECQACGTPIIVTDVPGLMEATHPSVSSVVIHRKNDKELADALLRFYFNQDLRTQVGNAARDFVSDHYEINDCFLHIEKLFYDVQRSIH